MPLPYWMQPFIQAQHAPPEVYETVYPLQPPCLAEWCLSGHPWQHTASGPFVGWAPILPLGASLLHSPQKVDHGMSVAWYWVTNPPEKNAATSRPLAPQDILLLKPTTQFLIPT